MSAARVLPASRLLPAGVMLVATVAPFEVPLPGSLLGLTLTSVELAIMVALTIAVAVWARQAQAFTWRTPISLPLIALLGSALLSAMLAPEFRGDALRVVARLVAAAALFSLVANVSRSTRAASHLAAALLLSGAIVGVIAVLELTQMPWVLNALKVFRPGFHVVGGQLRATSTLIYPTITSMFLEIAFALGLVWIGSSRLAFAALALVMAGVVATFTRSGLLTIVMSLAIFGGITFVRQREWTRELTRLVALALILVALVLMSRSPQMLLARMSNEGSQEWYGASYQVPAQLTLRPDSFNDIPVTLTNDGGLTWQSQATPPFALSYHWLTPGTEEVVIFDGLRTPFPQPVSPGAKVTMNARVRAPGYPGTYTLIWDVVQEHRTWLSLEGVYPGRSTASIEGSAVTAPLPTRGRMPSGVMRMPRRVLWSTAFDLWRTHPLFGIGPDNFRHVYGRPLGLAAWDDRVHANNSYIEVLTGMGAVGVIALGWLLWNAGVSAVDQIRTVDDATLPFVAAAVAACVAIASHALVDSFLTFTPTYVAFAIAAGVLFAPRRSCA